jgi:fermentation-respiration switch protein FrsA (DUF1100 family)
MFNKISKFLAVICASLFSFASISEANSEGASQALNAKQESIVTLAAFTKKVSSDGKVKTKPITFKRHNIKMAGVLYLPADTDESKKYPAIVVVHPGGGIKEQTAGLYAFNLAQLGYITLAFDASHQGESGGEPRLLEDPTARVEDARSAVDYLTTLPFIDRERIGALGICAGGGYAISVTQTEHRIKAVATVSAVDIGEGFRRGWNGNASVAEQIKTLEAVAKQRTAEVNGAEPMMIPYVPDAVDKNTEPDLAEAHEYYRMPTRWQHPNSPNRLLFSSVDKIMAFSAFDRIDTLLTQPLLLIAGSNAGSRWHSEKAFKLAKGPKELFIVDGATHMSMYDKDVNKAMPKLTAFFGKNLKYSTK